MLPMALYCVYPSAVYLLPLPAASSVSTGAHRRTGCNLPLPARMPLELYGRSHALGSIGRREMSKLSLEVIIFKRLDNKIIWRWEFVIHIIIKEERGTIIIIWRGKRERVYQLNVISVLFDVSSPLWFGISSRGQRSLMAFFSLPSLFCFPSVAAIFFWYGAHIWYELPIYSAPHHHLDYLSFWMFNFLQVSWVRQSDLAILASGGVSHTSDGRITASADETLSDWELRITDAQTKDSVCVQYRTNWCFFVNN